MTIPDIATLPPADAEQQHLVDEIQHPTDYERFQHGDFPTRCGECGQPVTANGTQMPRLSHGEL